LQVPAGSIVGLIGPNGAGKTTLFNCVTGVVRPDSGRVFLFGRDVTSWPAHRRARLGMGRTFQRLELFGSLTVMDNLMVAAETHAGRGGLFIDLLSLPTTRRAEARTRARAEDVLTSLGLEACRDVQAGDLPTGTSRLVELARALCMEPRLLLLDEPSSGQRGSEVDELGRALRRVRETGTAILLVEHDMSFVLGICDYVYVLDFGRLLAKGLPDEVRRDDVVQAAYLGTEGVE